MANDFHTRPSVIIPEPMPPVDLEATSSRPSKRVYIATGARIPDFIKHIFQDKFPSLDELRCFKQALRRCLEGDLGWLIWEQITYWPPVTAQADLWPDLIIGVRRLIILRPPWLVAHRDITAEQRRVINTRTNRERDVTIDQNLVAKMQSRIKQWLATRYRAPLSNPAWEILVRHTNASKATRYKIMQRAKDAGLISEITHEMLMWINERSQEQTPEQLQERQKDRERQQRRWRKRAQQLAAEREQTWKQHLRQARQARGESVT